MSSTAIEQLQTEAWSHALMLRLAGVSQLPVVEVTVAITEAAPSRFDRPAAPPEPVSDPAQRLAALANEVAQCTRCPLHQGRTQTVFADGPPRADIMFVGEGPGAEEDKQGLPFVGPAGQLLTRIIEAMGFARDSVYIANIVKCRPPNNRAPEAEEMAACVGYLRAQIDCVRPKVLVLLGGTAAKGLLATSTGITRLRGHWQTWMGIPVMPTFHPAYLLRLSGQALAEAKRQVWSDVQQARDRARAAKP